MRWDYYHVQQKKSVFFLSPEANDISLAKTRMHGRAKIDEPRIVQGISGEELFILK